MAWRSGLVRGGVRLASLGEWATSDGVTARRRGKVRYSAGDRHRRQSPKEPMRLDGVADSSR